MFHMLDETQLSWGGAVGSSGLGSQQSNDRHRTDHRITPLRRAFRSVNTITTTTTASNVRATRSSQVAYVQCGDV